MHENRDLVNTNHILSSMTPKRDRPSLSSFISDGTNDNKMHIQPLHYRPGAKGLISPKFNKNPLTPAARDTVDILKADRNASIRGSGT